MVCAGYDSCLKWRVAFGDLQRRTGKSSTKVLQYPIFAVQHAPTSPIVQFKVFFAFCVIALLGPGYYTGSGCITLYNRYLGTTHPVLYYQTCMAVVIG